MSQTFLEHCHYSVVSLEVGMSATKESSSEPAAAAQMGNEVGTNEVPVKPESRT